MFDDIGILKYRLKMTFILEAETQPTRVQIASRTRIWNTCTISRSHFACRLA